MKLKILCATIVIAYGASLVAIDLQDIAKLGPAVNSFQAPVQKLITEAPKIFGEVQHNTAILQSQVQGIQDKFGRGIYDAALGQISPFLDTLAVLSQQIATLIALIEPIFKPTSEVVGIFDKSVAANIQQVTTTLNDIAQQLQQVPDTEKKLKETLDKILPLISIVSKFIQ